MFHLAIPVHDLQSAEAFYTCCLECTVGRRDAQWIDFNFFGHQLTVHAAGTNHDSVNCNPVDGHAVPSRHFGVILDWESWNALAEKLGRRGVEFYIAPTIRFAGKVGEQGTFFIQDPSGNFLEFKTFKDTSRIFAVDP